MAPAPPRRASPAEQVVAPTAHEPPPTRGLSRRPGSAPGPCREHFPTIRGCRGRVRRYPALSRPGTRRTCRRSRRPATARRSALSPWRRKCRTRSQGNQFSGAPTFSATTQKPPPGTISALTASSHRGLRPVHPSLRRALRRRIVRRSRFQSTLRRPKRSVVPHPSPLALLGSANSEQVPQRCRPCLSAPAHADKASRPSHRRWRPSTCPDSPSRPPSARSVLA